MTTALEYTARVEQWVDGKWTLCKMLWAANPDKAKDIGVDHARSVWRAGAAGVRVTVISPEIVLERMR